MGTQRMNRLLCVLAALLLASCEGPVGPSGPEGPQGPPGRAGKPGVAGSSAGNIIVRSVIFGTLEFAPFDGCVGWDAAYYDIPEITENVVQNGIVLMTIGHSLGWAGGGGHRADPNRYFVYHEYGAGTVQIFVKQVKEGPGPCDRSSVVPYLSDYILHFFIIESLG